MLLRSINESSQNHIIDLQTFIIIFDIIFMLFDQE